MLFKDEISHTDKHIWNDKSKQTYGKNTSYFIKSSDLRAQFDKASKVFGPGKAFVEPGDKDKNGKVNRYVVETFFDSQELNLKLGTFKGKNEKGEEKNYRAVKWVFENKGTWVVASAYPTHAT